MSDIKTNSPEDCEYQPGQTANYMLEKADQEGFLITPMKLQKLIYNGYGWVLAILNRRLFDESIEAWEHGPVVPSIYHEFKHFGWSPIDERCVQFRPFTPGHENPEPLALPTDKEDCSVLKIVWKVYKNFSAPDLSANTHLEGTPWYKARHSKGGGNPRRHVNIKDEDIQAYFEENIRGYLRAIRSER